ncbi:MAG: hypothetical protein WDA07_11640 [Leucobacter sp.]
MNTERVEPRRGSARRTILIVAAIIGVLLIMYGFTLGPAHYANATAKSASGIDAVEIGGGARITPAEGWSIEPQIENLVAFPAPLPSITSWSVLFGGGGSQLRSPDHELVVEFTTHSGEDPASLLDEAAGIEEASGVRSETLESGLALQHVDGARKSSPSSVRRTPCSSERARTATTSIPIDPRSRRCSRASNTPLAESMRRPTRR